MTEREDPEPVDEPATVGMPAVEDEAEPAVEGVAVELPDEPPPAAAEPEAPTAQAPEPLPAAPPAAPVTIHEPPPPPAAPSPASNPIVDVPAPGATPSFDGHAHQSPANPVGEIAATRPELLVGAAFAGGILAAMILRRLGN